ncbi:MAG TPA: oligoribonuclease [Candidatus Saccharimonadia bacterium]|nr:oligoribonuclease [Candidatus Saccharimonadia bacterium]
MNIDKDARSTKLLWMDLEMTGLDPKQHVITEVGVVVTDWDFKTLNTYEAIILHSEEVLDKASDWVKQQDLSSGLLNQVRQNGRPEKEVLQELAGFIQEQFGDEPAVLAGNSIHQDRRFIREWWPEIETLLHYRMLDVSSWKLVMGDKYGVAFTKQERHRAIEDIHESIAELQYYLAWLQDARH